MPSLNTRLESSPLVLRLPTDEDVDQITELCQDAEIARWTRVPSPYSRADAETFVEFAREEAASGRGAHFSVVHQERIVGSCGLPRVDWADLTAEVGYWMGAAWRGKGFTTLAASAVCQWSFDVLGLERLELLAAEPNAASNAVARKLGFHREGIARNGAIVGHTGTPGAPRVDVNTYGLLPEEFRSLQEKAS